MNRKLIKFGETSRNFLLCRKSILTLESGERIKRGCGQKGLLETEVGWRCFYCGNYIYATGPSLAALWFHFRTAREYWRAMSRNDREFINGMPVTGKADPLPRRLLVDLDDPNPPGWFPYYIVYDEDQFQRYLDRMEAKPRDRLG